MFCTQTSSTGSVRMRTSYPLSRNASRCGELSMAARDIERQIFAVDDTLHKAQVFRQQFLRVAHDEHAFDVEMDSAVGIADEKIERRFCWNVQQCAKLRRSFRLHADPLQRIRPVMA